MKKINILASLFCINAVLLAGCGAFNSVDETTLIIDNNGTVVEAIVEPFNEDYYSIEELESMITKEVDAYNQSKGEEGATYKECSYRDKDASVIVEIEYQSTDDYVNMNGRDLFYGTVLEAKQAGYKIPELETTDDAQSKVDVTTMEDYYIVISSENLVLKVKDKILYTNEEVTIINNKEAKLNTQDGELSYVILE